MAAVYVAMDTRLERRVAIKVIRKDIFGTAALDQLLKRFEREAKSLARLSHPNIVGVFDYGEYEGAPYLVMEYVPGGTLKKLTGKPLPWQEAVRLLLPVASALCFAHQNGIIHRDVKPANILLTADGEPMLSDFGVAKILEAAEGVTLTGTGVGIGTPEYMAPEQGLGTPLDGRADVYALGVVLYELVTGRKPYTADTPIAVVLKHVNDPLPNPKKFVPDLPDDLILVLIKALAKHPQDRYPDMPAFEAVLEHLAVAMEPPSRKPVFEQPPLVETIVERARPVGDLRQASSRLKPWLLAGVGLVTLSILAGICTFGFIVFRSRNASAVRGAATTQAYQSAGLESTPGEAASLLSTTSLPTAAPDNALIVAGPDPTAAAEGASSETSTPSLAALGDQPQGQIAFTCQVFKDGKRNQICLVNPDGSGLGRLTTGADEYDHTYPSWAPSGNSVVFSSNRSGEYAIYEMTLAGEITQLTDGSVESYAPDISPDGSWIVYTVRRGDFQDLMLMERNGDGSIALYSSDSNSAWDPVWSPDGSRILFASDRMGGIQLYTMARNGTDIRQVTSMAGLRGRSDWSPDGLTLATYAGDSWHREIFLVGLIDDNLRQLTEGGNNLAPSFSPDGRWIAITSYKDLYGDDNGCEIYILKLETGEMSRLTDNDYCDWQPRWGP